jgi:hypothetical protein
MAQPFWESQAGGARPSAELAPGNRLSIECSSSRHRVHGAYLPTIARPLGPAAPARALSQAAR